MNQYSMLEHAGEFLALDPSGKRHRVNIWTSATTPSGFAPRNTKNLPQSLTLDDGTEIIRLSRGLYERMAAGGVKAIRYISDDPKAP